MGYTPGFEGPHPSKLPSPDPALQLSCDHTGYLDRWHGDDVTPPGYVFTCGQQCGHPYAQKFESDRVLEQFG